MAAEPVRARFAPVSAGRQIGPIGTASRAVVGALALLVAGSRGDLTWWDVAAAVAAFPLLAAVAHRVVRRAWTGATPVPTPRPRPASFAAGVVALAIAVGLTFVSPADEPAVWLWIGVSLVLAAAHGDAGCEVLAVANLLTGRRDRVGCIVFTPIDAAEARRLAARRAARRRGYRTRA